RSAGYHSRATVSASALRQRPPHACGEVSNVCCDASAPSVAVFKFSGAPAPPPKPAIACTSCAFELSDAPIDPGEPVETGANPPSCQSRPTEPNSAAPVI